MNKLINKLPLLAFVVAGFAAFAFNFPDKEVTSKYGSDGIDTYDVTNVDMGPGADEYWCNEETVVCLFQDENLQTPVPDSEGRFIPGNELDPIE